MSESANKNNSRRQRRGGRGGAVNKERSGKDGRNQGENKENERSRSGGEAKTQRQRLESEMSDGGGGDNCPVCLYKMNIFSIGECNHAVCYTCSTRMRVLIQRNECAICRRDLPKVIMTSTYKNYEDIKDSIFKMDRKHKICFETEDIQKKYMKLLDHNCVECEFTPSFKTFRQLDNHMRSEHQKYYCDLCVSHLKSFSFERKVYDRAGLMEHRRTGDKDDTSFKGHPLCEFCDKRWIDKDELYKHLRKDHYFCHFCDADGMQFFYSEYSDLRQHFKKDHFLCEERECEEAKFVVFRSEIDLKAHTLELHGNNLTKAAKQNSRRVELDFSYANRNAREGGREERSYGRGGGREDRGYDREERGHARGSDRGEERSRREERSERRSPELYDQLDGPVRESLGPVPDLVADFPSLGATGQADFPSLGAQAKPPANKFEKSSELAKKLAASSGHNTGSASGQSWAGRGGAAPSAMDEFPSLPGAPPAGPPTTASRPAYKAQAPAQPKRKAEPAPSHEEQFPGLPSTSRKPVPSSKNRQPAAASLPARPAAAIRPSPAPPRPTARNPPKPPRPMYDSDEDNYPTLGGPNRSLTNFSEKIVRSSGQDMDYSRKEHGGNINVVDQSLLEQLKGSSLGNGSRPPPTSKLKVMDSAADFPVLGPSEGAFSSISKKKNKSKGNNNNNNNNNKGKKAGGSGPPASLSSIADMLEPASSKSSNSQQSCDKSSASQPKAREVSEIKPIPSKLEPCESIIRPSKLKPQPAAPSPAKQPTKKSSPPAEVEEFPSLGAPAKKMSARFTKLEDKLVKPKPAQSQWANGPLIGGVSEVEPSKPRRGRGPPPGLSKFVFHPPPDFQKRNSALITTVSDCLGGKSIEFKKFRDTSSRFRAGDLSSEEYFGVCSKLFATDFASIFSELLVLLPDIRRQGELLSLLRSKFVTELLECPTCRQVLSVSDVEDHSSSHFLDDDFPVLG